MMFPSKSLLFGANRSYRPIHGEKSEAAVLAQWKFVKKGSALQVHHTEQTNMMLLWKVQASLWNSSWKTWTLLLNKFFFHVPKLTPINSDPECLLITELLWDTPACLDLNPPGMRGDPLLRMTKLRRNILKTTLLMDHQNLIGRPRLQTRSPPFQQASSCMKVPRMFGGKCFSWKPAGFSGKLDNRGACKHTSLLWRWSASPQTLRLEDSLISVFILRNIEATLTRIQLFNACGENLLVEVLSTAVQGPLSVSFLWIPGAAERHLHAWVCIILAPLRSALIYLFKVIPVVFNIFLGVEAFTSS